MNNSALLPTAQAIKLDTNRYTSQYDRLDNYNDLNALQSLKYKSESDREGAQTEFYQQMFDSQLAVSLSTGRGIGLAEVIKRQMSKDTAIPTIDIPQQGLPLKGRRQLDSEGVDRKSFSLENYARLPFVSEQKITQLEKAVVSIDDLIAQLPADVRGEQSKQITLEAPVNSAQTILPEKFSGPQDFIASLYPFAKEVERETGIDARLMLAQSALETGWGQYPILKQDGSPSFNLFGIKANATWQGDAANITTTEFRGGVSMKEQANFRAYRSYAESFDDYAQFLQSNGRYQEALAVSDQPKAFAKELQEAGYATDPDYAEKIGSIVDRYFEGLGSSNQSETSRSSLNKSIPGAEG